jgi:creatinine amidohydrolase
VSYAVDELPWPEVGRILAEDPRLIFPVGALEQHGPQLPCGTNATLARHVATEVSERLGILRAPIFSYGVAVGGGPFPGPAGLRRKTFHRAVNELLSRWQDDGVQHFVVITAHRFEPHLEALLMTPSVLASKSVYDLYQIDVSDILESDPEFEHAGELETSLMMHLAPESPAACSEHPPSLRLRRAPASSRDGSARSPPRFGRRGWASRSRRTG